MLLGREMEVFCDILMDRDGYIPGFGTKDLLKITVALGGFLVSSSYKDSMSNFFSEKTQGVLLHPFRRRLHGFKKVKVRGLVSRDMADAVEQELAQDIVSDRETTLASYQAQKDEGQDLYKSGMLGAACLKWQDATLEIKILHAGSSWQLLIAKVSQ